MALRVADLEVLFTANTADIAKAEREVKQTGEKIERKPIEQKVDADTKPALDGMDRVEAAAKRLVSHDTAVQIDSNIERAEKGIERTEKRLEYLRSVETELDVSADVKRAEARLQKLERQRDALTKSRAQIEVDADTIPAEDALDDLEDESSSSGRRSGDNLGKGIIAALATIPIAGAIAGIASSVGEAVSSAFQEGLQQEVTRDRVQALTGIDEAGAIRLAHASGEAYANAYGDSIESNMDTARLALQFNILDETATTRDSQKVIQSLSGIADVLGEDVRPVAAAVTTMLSSGLADSAEEAFDLLATGAREGVNRNEDLLDTLTEYPALFSKLGLSGEEALGLVNQGMQAGARNSDLAADALKEFQIRATDASDTSAEGFTALGLSAEDMTAKIARGGEDARDGLAEVLTALRETEDPVKRNAAAVALFGTQAEDLGEALYAMDLSSAVEELDGVTGSAQRMLDTLADNDATKMESAKRNIETAAAGIQGALAVAFSEPLGDLADWVSANRGEIMQFLYDLANGALDFGVSVVEGTAAGTEAFGEFVSGPLAQATAALATFLDYMPGMDGSELGQLSIDMQNFGQFTDDAADDMRETLIPSIEGAREEMNSFLEGAVEQGHLHDATMRTADALQRVGANAKDGATLVDGYTIATDGSARASELLDSQIRNALAAMADEIDMAADAGESQENLTDRYNTSREALVGQMQQMGLTRGQAQKLIDTVMKTPKDKRTRFSSNAADAQGKVDDLASRITALPDGSVVVTADTSPAQAAINQLILDNAARAITLATNTFSNQAAGSHLQMMAGGGQLGLTPMAPIAQKVPPNTWRVVGDRMKDDEFFIPDDDSARSHQILQQAMRSFGYLPMADGGVATTGTPGRGAETGSQGPDRAFLQEIAAAIESGQTAPLIGNAYFTEAGARELQSILFALRAEKRGTRRRGRARG
ncbi:phage tail tape measure protein [Microbacterium excoecariae]|uniref:phage tail tape measure protein n=1 Tax=Microbacterium excoecariae TaxID=2715210 RepID=UPI00140A0EEC|nr:phage tail tape measure protein [Microbacterium excoecariae]NHI16868.1 hypothetical protein [Microbacterium excoecariae]